MAVLTPLPITALWGGTILLVSSLASLGVGLTRAATKKFYGATSNSVLEHRVRAAGTLLEYGVPGTLLLALLEYHGLLSETGLWWWGAAFTVLRVVHAIQLALPRHLPLNVRSGSFLATIALLAYASLKLIGFGFYH